jgi:hypothetical protein
VVMVIGSHCFLIDFYSFGISRFQESGCCWLQDLIIFGDSQY